jgi:DNA-directed RNA polymerase subunit RPC12/RpoP
MEKETFRVGDRVEKLCAVCGEERGHVVASVTKTGRISRVSCPQCGTRSTFKTETGRSSARASVKAGAPYDWTRTYRTGQTMLHPTYGPGEVVAVIEPQKIDVLFSDRMRRLIHSRA